MKNLFFALAFMLIGTSTFANNAKEIEYLKIEKRVEIVKIIKTAEADYEIVVKRIIKDSSCTELHVVCTELHVVRYRGETVCEFEAVGEEPCGVTFHIL